jgi:tetratricopeptide (TPR) repeat protein
MKTPQSTKQILVIAGVLVLTAAMYFAPRKTKESVAEVKLATQPMAPSINFDERLRDVKKGIPSSELKKISDIEIAVDKAAQTDKAKLLDSLGKTYDRFQLPDVAAHYYEEIAKKGSVEKDWLNAAYRYFDAFRASEDSLLRNAYVQKAIVCYVRVLEINPNNLDAKTDLGVCYTETPQPMQGIMMLREVVKSKPDHENAQMNLGLLSVRSKQFDRAIERFIKVIEINPKREEAYLYLGKSYAETGNKAKAIETFKKYLSISKNAEMKNTVKEYIEQLRKI